MFNNSEPNPQPTQAPWFSGTKKTAILSLVGVFLVALVAVSILVVYKPGQPSGDKADDQANIQPDLSKDFGACEQLSVDVIKSTLGTVAADLKGPKNAGLLISGNNDDTQLCVYPFGDEGTMANRYNIDNAFSLEVYVFKSTRDKQDAILMTEASAFFKSSLGDKVSYESFGGQDDGTLSYRLSIYKGTRRFLFQISQPTKDIAFTKEDGKKVLLKLAAQADYEIK